MALMEAQEPSQFPLQGLCRALAGQWEGGWEPWQKQGEREWLQARQGKAAEDSAVAAASSLPTAHFLGVLLL